MLILISPDLIPVTINEVENRIGQIRRFFPKKTDLSMVTDYQVKRVEQLLNNRPVRKFNYLTPNQVLQQKIALIT